MKKHFRSFKCPSEKWELAPGGSDYRSQRGVALVITLIMLSVTLVMALAFLAISRRDRASVSSTTDVTTARLAADSALAQAQAKIIANLAVNTNLNLYSLLVSTNYINPGGFLNGFTFASPNNVNYANAMNSGNPAELAQNIANLQVLPRAPVLMSSNEIYGRFYLDLNRNGAFEANGFQPQVDASGLYYHSNGTVSADLAGVVSNFMTGDPEWIGILARPDAPHSANNQFIGRFAFLAQPIGNTLDFNYVHNQARNASLNRSQTSDGYFRNQGVGTWEINLAAFLADLNTNVWDSTSYGIYQYLQPASGGANKGEAFVDAFSILTNRYAANINSLASAQTLFALNNAYRYFWYDNIDEYSDGPLQTSTRNIVETTAEDTALPWAGANNTNRYFVLDDLFNTNYTGGFAADLQAASQNISTYNRYTYYRMLDQIGVDSALPSEKLNLNYNNANVFSNTFVNPAAVYPPSETNFLTWTPLGLFTNVADRLLRQYTTAWYQTPNPTNLPNYYQSNYLAVYFGYHTNGYLDANGAGFTNFPYFGMTNQIPSFGITNIPVIYNGNMVYGASINRLLQLAANIVDATSNNFYPSVFKPLYIRPSPVTAPGNVSIGGFIQLTRTVSGLNDPNYFGVVEDFNRLVNDTTRVGPTVNIQQPSQPVVYGIPLIIGAKSGFPNFNEFSVENTISVTRRLGITKKTAADPASVPSTNQSFVVGITGQLGVELWNSYTNAYPSANVRIQVSDVLTSAIKSTNGVFLYGPETFLLAPPIMSPLTPWPGTGWKNGGFENKDPNAFSFFVPLNTNANILPNQTYQFLPPHFQDASLGLIWDNSYPPRNFDPLFVQTTNYVRVLLTDNGHIIDYVQFAGPIESTNITAVFQNTNQIFPANPQITGPNSDMWNTTPTARGIPLGVVNQIEVSRAQPPTPPTQWAQLNPKDVDKFFVFMGGARAVNSVPFPAYRTDPTVLAEVTNASAQAPYSPTVVLHDYFSLQANDPLVHYLANDLVFYGPALKGLSPGMTVDVTGATNATGLPNIGALNDRYGPWGRSSAVSDGSPLGNGSRNAYNATVQDPSVWSSDFWAFPTNKFPSIGWLGRVHRGTPWQTVYLKSRDVLNQSTYGLTTWQNWMADRVPLDAIAAAPRADRLLFDLFTAAPNDNATYGQLSVNQSGLAAWSALFGGMVALTNLNNNAESGTLINYGWTNISPAGINSANSALGRIVTSPIGINATRANTNLFPTRSFQHVGDILAVPALTDQSPFFNTNSIEGATPYLTNGITDAAYEWLPQQALQLLKLDSSPRYVIYCYGQTLKPVQGAQVTSGANFGLTTNYQVVAESAAKAVVQVHANVVIQNGRSTTNYTTTVESYNVLPPD